MKNHYLKPWIIAIAIVCLLPVFFSSCKEKEDEEEEIPVCTLTHSYAIVESEKGSVILTDEGPFILSEYKWEESSSLKSVIDPYLLPYDIEPIDLSKYIGKGVTFSGELVLIHIETMTIDGEAQDVIRCKLRKSDLHFTE